MFAVELKKLLLKLQKMTSRSQRCQRASESGDKGVTRGARGAQFPGRRITGGDAEKSQQCHTHFLQYSTFACEKPQVRIWGHQTCFLPRASFILVKPLSGDSTFLVHSSEVTNVGQNNDIKVQEKTTCSVVESESVETEPSKIQKSMMSTTEHWKEVVFI